MNEIRTGLLEKALRACVDEYVEKGRTFTNLDTKAQNTTALAGVFLAAALAFLREEALEAFVRSGGRHTVILLAASIISLLGSILSCLLAMRIRKVIAPIEPVALTAMVDDILSLDASELTDVTYGNFLRDQIAAWQPTLADASTANASKAKAVLAGQFLLTAAIVFIAILLLVILTTVWHSASP
jgi:hypothetical protein